MKYEQFIVYRLEEGGKHWKIIYHSLRRGKVQLATMPSESQSPLQKRLNRGPTEK